MRLKRRRSIQDPVSLSQTHSFGINRFFFRSLFIVLCGTSVLLSNLQNVFHSELILVGVGLVSGKITL
jgi:hypothetical protein